MSLGKSVAKFVSATLFTTFLSLFIVLLSVQDLTSYENMKSLSLKAFSGQEEQVDAFIKQACGNAQSFEIQVQGEKLTFSCSDVASAGDFFARNFDALYNRNYSCSVLDCIKQPQSLASAHGNKIFSEIALLSAVAAILSGIAMLYLLDRKVKGSGTALIFVGLNYIALAFTRGLVPEEFGAVLNPMFSSMETAFLYILAAGIVLFVVGVYTKR